MGQNVTKITTDGEGITHPTCFGTDKRLVTCGSRIKWDTSTYPRNNVVNLPSTSLFIYRPKSLRTGQRTMDPRERVEPENCNY